MASVNGWPRWAKAFLAALEVDGVVLHAAKAADISPRQAYRYRKENKEFFTAWEEAEWAGSEALVAEAYRRAVDGVKRPIYSQGKYVADEIVYSDTMLSLLLKAKRPTEYRERVSQEITGAAGGPVELRVVYENMKPSKESAE